MKRGLAVTTLALSLVACDKRAPVPSAPEAWSAEELTTILSMSPLPPLPPSEGNAVADDPAAAALGHRLFFDRGLSARGDRSCASCHDPSRAFTDGRARARGSTELSRNTPSLLGVGWSRSLTWDGRKDSVWAQSLAPLVDPREHGLSALGVALRIGDAHRAPYEAVFGALPALPGPRERDVRAAVLAADTSSHHEDEAAFATVLANVGKALEAYQRKLGFGEAPFDRYVAALRAGDPNGGGHLSAAAQRGLRSFLGPAGCISCHHGPLLSDGEFHNLGLPPARVGSDDELGRAHGAAAVLRDRFRCGSPHSDARTCDELRFLDPSFPEFVGAFRTPSLRNVARTSPYMHGGQLATLDEVVAYYKTLPGAPSHGARDPLLQRLPASLSTADVVAFLESLTGTPAEAPWSSPPTHP